MASLLAPSTVEGRKVHWLVNILSTSSFTTSLVLLPSQAHTKGTLHVKHSSLVHQHGDQTSTRAQGKASFYQQHRLHSPYLPVAEVEGLDEGCPIGPSSARLDGEHFPLPLLPLLANHNP